jgi:hypothetical protein
LRGMTKNSSFLHFRTVFVSYCPQFWGSGWFTRSMTLSTCLRGMTKNSSFFFVFGPFSWAIAHCFGGSVEIYKEYDSQYILFERHDQKLVIFAFMAVFMSYYP